MGHSPSYYFGDIVIHVLLPYVTILFLVGPFPRRCEGSDEFFASCPENLRGMEDFNSSAAVGKWFEAERFGGLSDYGGSCVQFEYTPIVGSNGSLTTEIRHQHLGGWSKWESKGTSTPQGRTGKADFTLDLKVSMFYSVSLNYSILSSDYKHFAVLWACQDDSHMEGLWILTRSLSGYTQEIRMRSHGEIQRLGLDPLKMKLPKTC